MNRKRTKLSVQLALSIMRFDATINSTLEQYPYLTMDYILGFIEHAAYGFFAAQRRRI